MRFLISLFMVFSIGAVSHAVILLPGKIEEPVRANKIIAEKFQAKKVFLDKHRKRIKEKFSLMKKNQIHVVSAPQSLLPGAVPGREETVRSKGLATDGTIVPEQGKQLQE